MHFPQSETRLAIVWIGLVGATVLSLFTSGIEGAAHGVAVVILLALAYGKARLVFMEFVGIGYAPRGWQLFFESWLLLVIVEIGFFYWR